MVYKYKTKGVCASSIEIDYDENTRTVNKVKFFGGCSGNTQGIAALVKGMQADEVISRLEGIRCGFKATSCPDQLTKALKEITQE